MRETQTNIIPLTTSCPSPSNASELLQYKIIFCADKDGLCGGVFGPQQNDMAFTTPCMPLSKPYWNSPTAIYAGRVVALTTKNIYNLLTQSRPLNPNLPALPVSRINAYKIIDLMSGTSWVFPMVKCTLPSGTMDGVCQYNMLGSDHPIEKPSVVRMLYLQGGSQNQCVSRGALSSANAESNGFE